jgi:hypothetical protein
MTAWTSSSGVDGPLPRRQPDVADGRAADQFAAPGLVQLALVHPLLEDVQFGLAHGALQPEQESVVVVARVVEPVGVRQQDPEAGARLEELVPVLAGAGETADLQAEDQADLVQGDFGQKPLEARSPLGRLAAAPQVVVDDLDAVASPAEVDRPASERVLAGRRFLVFGNLLERRLTHVDDGSAAEVPGLNFGRTGGLSHGRPPWRVAPRAAGRGVGRAGRSVVAAGRWAGSPTGGEPAMAGPSAGAGGSWGGSGVAHAVPPVSVPRCWHQRASSSNAATPMVTHATGSVPSRASGVV